MKVTNKTNYSILIAGETILAGETKSINDKDFQEVKDSRVISALINKRCIEVVESKKKAKEVVEPKEEELTEELKAFYDL